MSGYADGFYWGKVGEEWEVFECWGGNWFGIGIRFGDQGEPHRVGPRIEPPTEAK